MACDLNMGLIQQTLRTRIIQAVGRCSRNPSDYSIVCVLGDTIRNEITKPAKVKQFAPELRAEIEFGVENSSAYQTAGDVLEQAVDFLGRTKEWEAAEESIVEQRNAFWDESDDEAIISEKLQATASLELRYQYAMWKKDYENAYSIAASIVDTLNAPGLKGYKCYWNYILGVVAYYLVKQGNREYQDKGIKNFEDALKYNISIKWLPNLSKKLYSWKESETTEPDYYLDCIENIESQFSKVRSSIKLESIIEEIVSNLRSSNGGAFERGHQKLGEILGYTSRNSDASGAPDPYWIVNSNLVIVSEDKIYEEKENVKPIPIKDVREASSHKIWIQECENDVAKGASIVAILISNSKQIEDKARIYANDLYYVNRDEYVNWAIKALNIIRSHWMSYTEEGNYEWRESLHADLIQHHVTPRDYLTFVQKRKLNML